MALPKAVQQQAEEADRLMAQFDGDAPGDNPPADQNIAPQDPPQDSINEPPAQVNTDIPAEPQQASQVPEDTWEKKYHVLQGKFDAEVPRLYADLREMKAQLQQVSVDKAVAEAKAAQQPAPEPVKSLVTEQDKEAFGSDLIDLIERATESKVSTLRARESELLGKISKLEGQIGSVSERQGVSDNDRFLMGLGQRVTDWEQLNTDSGFLAWLAEVDPVYGLPRQAALNSATEAFDVNRVASIFNSYKALLAPKQAAQLKPSQQLQSQVAPTRSRVSNAPTSTDSNSKIWQQTEIGQFYDDWRRGFLDNDEAVRMEREIDLAISQGRVS